MYKQKLELNLKKEKSAGNFPEKLAEDFRKISGNFPESFQFFRGNFPAHITSGLLKYLTRSCYRKVNCTISFIWQEELISKFSKAPPGASSGDCKMLCLFFNIK